MMGSMTVLRPATSSSGRSGSLRVELGAVASVPHIGYPDALGRRLRCLHARSPSDAFPTAPPASAAGASAVPVGAGRGGSRLPTGRQGLPLPACRRRPLTAPRPPPRAPRPKARSRRARFPFPSRAGAAARRPRPSRPGRSCPRGSRRSACRPRGSSRSSPRFRAARARCRRSSTRTPGRRPIRRGRSSGLVTGSPASASGISSCARSASGTNSTCRGLSASSAESSSTGPYVMQEARQWCMQVGLRPRAVRSAHKSHRSVGTGTLFQWMCLPSISHGPSWYRRMPPFPTGTRVPPCRPPRNCGSPCRIRSL